MSTGLKCIIALISFCGVTSAEELHRQMRVEFHGALDGATDISGVARTNGLLAVVSDEGVTLDLLEKVTDGQFRLLRSVPLLKRNRDEHAEIDMEGVAADGNSLYVVGSHSLIRKRVDPENDYGTNPGPARTFGDLGWRLLKKLQQACNATGSRCSRAGG